MTELAAIVSDAETAARGPPVTGAFGLDLRRELRRAQRGTAMRPGAPS
jgi:hypothetical protein